MGFLHRYHLKLFYLPNEIEENLVNCNCRKSPDLMAAAAAQYDKDVFATVQNLIDLSLTCRPNDVIAFGKRFYCDELQGKSIEERSALHATHALPYLLCQSTSFQSFLCTLFCYHNFMVDLEIFLKIFCIFLEIVILAFDFVV